MHLLVAQSGTIDDGTEPCDLGQTPGDVIVLSAADTELALLAAAHAQRRSAENAYSLRLANLLQLKHNYSVDLYIEKTIQHAKLVVLRLLGGESYWPYLAERLGVVARANGISLIVLPGDDKPDAALTKLSTVDEEVCAKLWAYLVEGGLENAQGFLASIESYLKGTDGPPPARPLLKAGVYDHPACRLAGSHLADQPVAAVVFYRALYQSGDLAGIDGLVDALVAIGLRPVPIYAASLRDPVCEESVRRILDDCRPDVILNTTAFATSKPDDERHGGVLSECDVPVLQVVLSTATAESWQTGTNGLSARDIAMHVALPEVDGRILTRAVSFKADAEFDAACEHHVVRAQSKEDRAAFVARQAWALSQLKRTPPEDRRVALILANYPNRDSRLANGVGLDTPASAINVLAAMKAAGYTVSGAPDDGNALISLLRAGPTNADAVNRVARYVLPLSDYTAAFAKLPAEVRDSVIARWGTPENDPGLSEAGFAIAVVAFGNIVVGIQPARGYNIDPKATYHDPALVPPHAYFAFYFWLRTAFGAQAAVHLGKHGNLEWLPGKALALSETCYPEAALGALPNIYPFIVNDPGEGSQAKRRTSAVIIDHLMPPLTRADSYGPLHELEVLVDEYFAAAGVDEARRRFLQTEILAASVRLGLDKDFGFDVKGDPDAALSAVDNQLCELKELQIRDGLHVFGESPQYRQRRDTLVALARVPRGEGGGHQASLLRALANDLELAGFDPLVADLGAPWRGTRPKILERISTDAWRSTGDTVERLELLAGEIVTGEQDVPTGWRNTKAVLDWVLGALAARLDTSGQAEIDGVLRALDGRFVPPGPSGAPTRGRSDVLPTGRNFFSLDSRGLPTWAAWELGRRSAERLIERYCQDHGDWPKAIALSAWGTSNMRTGGDDIAQAMALMGVQPTWESASGRVTGFEIIPIAKLGRPRVDVTFRVSGFFRDAFPAQIDLIDSAARAVADLDEPDDDNPLAAAVRRESAMLEQESRSSDVARRIAGTRVFGSKPGAYGAGLQALIDEKIWCDESNLAEAYLEWGQYAYGGGVTGEANRQAFARRITKIDAVLHNQDNREHDILDSDDYYQFQGGLAVAAKALKGGRVPVYHGDHSRPERPVIRALEEEIGRVVRARAANPKWIDGVRRHGYKGAFEIAATVDYLFAFAVTTGAVGDHHFDALYDAYLFDDDVRQFLQDNNPDALREIADKFDEAITRNLWSPRRNSVPATLSRLRTGAQ